jgi:sugar phosphate isomerase/epimerase
LTDYALRSADFAGASASAIPGAFATDHYKHREKLNTLVDHAGYYLADIDTALAIVHEVGSPRLKILCDLYHFGVMGADLKKIVTNHLSEIGHFHIADVPGRHESRNRFGRLGGDAATYPRSGLHWLRRIRVFSGKRL